MNVAYCSDFDCWQYFDCCCNECGRYNFVSFMVCAIVKKIQFVTNVKRAQTVVVNTNIQF